MAGEVLWYQQRLCTAPCRMKMGRLVPLDIVGRRNYPRDRQTLNSNGVQTVLTIPIRQGRTSQWNVYLPLATAVLVVI
jgi:hypothetical protein